MKAPITLVIHLDYEVGDRDDECTEFFIEENHCLDNVICELAKRIEDNPAYCQTCNLASAFVGTIPFKDIGALPRTTSDSHGGKDG